MGNWAKTVHCARHTSRAETLVTHLLHFIFPFFREKCHDFQDVITGSMRARTTSRHITFVQTCLLMFQAQLNSKRGQDIHLFLHSSPVCRTAICWPCLATHGFPARGSRAWRVHKLVMAVAPWTKVKSQRNGPPWCLWPSVLLDPNDFSAVSSR